MKTSAGILLYRRNGSVLQLLLAHPGGPFWAKKDDGAWSIPKGEFVSPEEPINAALREFHEETGQRISGASAIPLTPIKQGGGKIVHAFAIEGEFEPAQLRSNTFQLHGKEYPEIDRAEWFSCDNARRKILKGQAPFIDELLTILSGRGLEFD